MASAMLISRLTKAAFGFKLTLHQRETIGLHPVSRPYPYALRKMPQYGNVTIAVSAIIGAEENILYSAHDRRAHEKSRPKERLASRCIKPSLLDFAFFEINVLAYNGVILTLDHFFSHGACVFLGHVEVTCVSRRVKTDFNGGWLRHGSRPFRKLNLKPPYIHADVAVNTDYGAQLILISRASVGAIVGKRIGYKGLTLFADIGDAGRGARLF